MALALLTSVKNGEAPAWPPEADAEEEEGVEGVEVKEQEQELGEARVQALLHPTAAADSAAASMVVEGPPSAGENKTDSAPSSPPPPPPSSSGSQAETAERDAAGQGEGWQGRQGQQGQPQYPKSFVEVSTCAVGFRSVAIGSIDTNLTDLQTNPTRHIPPHHATDEQIMQMAERGETPAGIQQVENRLSQDVADGQGYPSADAAAPRKPWEAVGAVGEGQGEAEADG